MKTRIYVDGYNLYYGCLKQTPYKWLDLVKLFEDHILPSSIPKDYDVTSLDVKYFTAEISSKAALDDNSVKDQQSYHRALTAVHPDSKFNIIKGYFAVSDAYAFLIDSVDPKKEPKHCEKVNVWKLEEKQTDVNMAVEAIYDVLTDDELKHVVFVTNDTDLALSLHKIKISGRAKIGLIVPTKETVRRASDMLSQHADWTRDHILNDELKRSYLPRSISESVRQNLRKPIIKPDSWFGQPDIIKQIFAILLPVLNGKRNKCWRWLETEKPEIAGLPTLHSFPIEMLDEEHDARKVLQHAVAYAKFKQEK